MNRSILFLTAPLALAAPSASGAHDAPYMLYGYAEVYLTNADGSYLVKPGTDVGFAAPVCIAWKSSFPNGVIDMDVVGYPTLISKLSFYADTRGQVLTISRVEEPNAIVTDDGTLAVDPKGPAKVWRENVNIRVPLYDAPRSDWNCSPQTWKTVGGIALHYRKGTMEIPRCGDAGSGTYWGTDGLCHGGVTWGTDPNPNPFLHCFNRNGNRIFGCKDH